MKAYQRASRVPLVGRLRVLHLDAAVDRDRVVDGAGNRQARLLDGEQAVPEALVVLHEIELVGSTLEVVPGLKRTPAARGKVPVLNAVTSAKSIHVLSSHRPGMRIGKWSL